MKLDPVLTRFEPVPVNKTRHSPFAIGRKKKEVSPMLKTRKQQKCTENNSKTFHVVNVVWKTVRNETDQS
jgi:hypothetical protein